MADQESKSWYKSLNLWFAVAVALAIGVIAWRRGQLIQGFDYRDNMAEAAATTVTALLALSIFLERAMSVVNAIVYGDDHREAEDKLLRGDQDRGETEMRRVLAKKERVRLFGAFVAALFVSAAGVRTLEGLLVTQGEGVARNSLLFPVDVVLTAALVAGGSNGLAFLAQVIKDRLAPPEPEADPAAPDDEADSVLASTSTRRKAAPATRAGRRTYMARMTTSG